MRRTRRPTTPPTSPSREQSSSDHACQKTGKPDALLCKDVEKPAALLQGSEVINELLNNIKTGISETPLPNGSAAKDVKEPQHTIAEVDVSLATDRKPRINPYVPSDKLDDKQERFVKEYQIDLSITKAAIRAGYDKANAYASGKRNMKQIKVLTAMALERAQVMLRAEASVDSVLEGLHAEAHYFGEGASHGARITALNSLGKHFNMFVDLSLSKSEVTIKIDREDSNL